MENDILNYVKQKTLKNYFNSNREFSKLFPDENFDFSASTYTHFLYFDKEEALEYISDFLLFIKKYYNAEVFSYNNYFSILDEFKKYMEKNNVLVYLKTKMGLTLANYSNELLLTGIKNLFGEQYFRGDDTNIAFSETLIKKQSFTYEFFNYLLEKSEGYNNYKYTVEPLLNNDQNAILNYFKGIPYNGTPPFYLNNKEYSKDIKKLLLETLTNEPCKVFAISKSKKVVVLIIANIEKTTCNLTILCDSDYYDSDLNTPIIYIADYMFKHFNIDKIISVNENKGIAYSGINSALVMSHFKPDYSLNSEFNGYSKIKYELKPSDIEDSEIHFDDSLINFVY